MARSPYEVLGVAKNATDDEIKKAYRKLARESHPDANQGDVEAEDRFKEVQGAYDLLSDAEKRKQYDSFGAAGPRGAGPGRRRVRVREHRPLRPARAVRRDLRPWRRASRPPTAGAWRRPRVSRSPLVRGCALGCSGQGAGRRRRSLSNVQRIGRRARHLSDHLPAMRRVGHRLRLPRAVRALAALPPLPRERPHRREPVQDLPWDGPGAGDEAATR